VTRPSFTVRSNTTNRGGIYAPRTLLTWRILLLENGEVTDFEVCIPSTSCPKKWLESKGYILEIDALAELIR
jgi:hypothetical protein